MRAGVHAPVAAAVKRGPSILTASSQARLRTLPTMKKSIALAALLSLIASVARAEVRVPAFTAYTDPDASGARISQTSGLTGWRDPNLKVSWFGDIKAPMAIDAAVELRLPA